MRCGLIRRSWVWFGAVRFGRQVRFGRLRFGSVGCVGVRFVLAGVASEVGHGMVGLFRQARCEKVRLVLVRCGIVRSGRLGSMRFGWARFGMVQHG